MKGNLVKRSKQDQEQEKLGNFGQQGTLHVMNGNQWKTLTVSSRVAQWKRAGPITQRSEDQNLALLNIFSFSFSFYIVMAITLFSVLN